METCLIRAGEKKMPFILIKVYGVSTADKATK